MKRETRRAAFWALAAVIAMTSACAKKIVKKPAGGGAPQAASGEPGIHGSRFVDSPELRVVHFDYDRHHLGKKALEILKRNAETIKQNLGWQVLIEGHCDERGTVEYNLALGQRRAKAVREYYLLLGVPGDRVATISYGAETPVCPRSTEDCWAENRRAENKVKAGVAGRTSDSET